MCMQGQGGGGYYYNSQPADKQVQRALLRRRGGEGRQRAREGQGQQGITALAGCVLSVCLLSSWRGEKACLSVGPCMGPLISPAPPHPPTPSSSPTNKTTTMLSLPSPPPLLHNSWLSRLPSLSPPLCYEHGLSLPRLLALSTAPCSTLPPPLPPSPPLYLLACRLPCPCWPRCYLHMSLHAPRTQPPPLSSSGGAFGVCVCRCEWYVSESGSTGPPLPASSPWSPRCVNRRVLS